MTILEFALLRGGFSPRELRLPDSVLEGADSRPLADLKEPIHPPFHLSREAAHAACNRELYRRKVKAARANA